MRVLFLIIAVYLAMSNSLVRAETAAIRNSVQTIQLSH